MRRVFVDTSVLFPFSVMDLFLALSEDGVHQVLWTDELLEEWERVIVREQRRTPETARSVTGAIREFFADCRILPESYATLVDQMPGNDPDDHVHMAAAVAAGVDALVTANQADFPHWPATETRSGGHGSRCIFNRTVRGSTLRSNGRRVADR